MLKSKIKRSKGRIDRGGHMAPDQTRDDSVPHSARGTQDIAAGLFLIVVALIAFWQAKGLPLGSLRAMGAGMLPTALAVLLGVFGIAIALIGALRPGVAFERWSFRGLLFVLGAIITFALTVRLFGLVVAGPLTMLIAGAADPQTNWKHTLIFSIVLTAFCILLFKVALRLPIPVITFL
jgi:putative tricarboxylic transport membrane protein